jgi:2-polyprenyl-3-methyl-5-hydroxy-6-metoxy-1,4-benzoquinol methylase
MDALDVRELGERFDVVLCFGILHRVTDPIALLRALAGHVVGGPERVEPEELIGPIAER